MMKNQEKFQLTDMRWELYIIEIALTRDTTPLRSAGKSDKFCNAVELLKFQMFKFNWLILRMLKHLFIRPTY